MAHLNPECRNKFAWCRKSLANPWGDCRRQWWPIERSEWRLVSTRWGNIPVPRRSTTSTFRRTSNFAPIAENEIFTFSLIWLITMKYRPGRATKKTFLLYQQNQRRDQIVSGALNNAEANFLEKTLDIFMFLETVLEDENHEPNWIVHEMTRCNFQLLRWFFIFLLLLLLRLRNKQNEFDEGVERNDEWNQAENRAESLSCTF